MIENVLGGNKSGAMMDAILTRMATDKNLGAVFPDDPLVVGWGKNFPFAENLTKHLPGLQFPKQFNFPIGSFFWIQAEVFSPLVRANFAWSDYPDEPVPYDGTILHAIERVMGLLPGYTGHTTLSTHTQGIAPR
jgi:hypothetical protein